MKAIVAVALPALLLLATVLYPLVHNRYVFPLGRLYGGIQKGAPCTEAEEKFRAYIAERSGHSHVRSMEFVATTDLRESRSVAPGRAFHLYDLSVFDDVQLSILCDAADRVTETLFIGD